MSKAKKLQEVKESVIVPSIQIEGKEHALQELFNKEDAPEIKSVGYAKVPGTNQYISYTITSKGTEVVKIEVEEPNLRQIAEESAKICFVNTFMTVEE